MKKMNSFCATISVLLTFSVCGNAFADNGTDYKRMLEIQISVYGAAAASYFGPPAWKALKERALTTGTSSGSLVENYSLNLLKRAEAAPRVYNTPAVNYPFYDFYSPGSSIRETAGEYTNRLETLAKKYPKFGNDITRWKQEGLKAIQDGQFEDHAPLIVEEPAKIVKATVGMKVLTGLTVAGAIGAGFYEVRAIHNGSINATKVNSFSDSPSSGAATSGLSDSSANHPASAAGN